jgi:sec-independent protein translocase protein TatB
MFDIGFWELVLVAVVALLAVGPERLPKLAYDAGKWFAKLQRAVRNIRYQIDNEMHQYEVRQLLQEQKKMVEDSVKQAMSDGQPPKDSRPIEDGKSEDRN